MDTSELIKILTTNTSEQFIIDVLNEVNNKDLNDLEKIILRDLLKIYYKICDNAVIKTELDKIIKKINDEKIKITLKPFNKPFPIAIVTFKKTPIDYLSYSTIYIHYTYQVFNMVVDDEKFKERIKELLFGVDKYEETLEIQQKRFQLYKEIYESILMDDNNLTRISNMLSTNKETKFNERINEQQNDKTKKNIENRFQLYKDIYDFVLSKSINYDLIITPINFKRTIEEFF